MHPMMMVVATRVMMPIALAVATYIFLRGHNEPGGGFIAGLIAAIAVVMQYMASGFAWAAERQRAHYHAIIGAGVLIASATGIGAWLAGRPFLTSAFGYVTIPPLNKFEVATAIAFDLGVFLTVLGAVMLALESIARYAWKPGVEVSGIRDGHQSSARRPAREDRLIWSFSSPVRSACLRLPGSTWSLGCAPFL